MREKVSTMNDVNQRGCYFCHIGFFFPLFGITTALSCVDLMAGTRALRPSDCSTHTGLWKPAPPRSVVLLDASLVSSLPSFPPPPSRKVQSRWGPGLCAHALVSTHPRPGLWDWTQSSRQAAFNLRLQMVCNVVIPTHQLVMGEGTRICDPQGTAGLRPRGSPGKGSIPTWRWAWNGSGPFR